MNKWWKTKKATSVYKDEDTGMYVCVYHDTPVVQWDEEKIILNSGGFRTVTTKRRMNEVSDHYNLGFDVTQHLYEWWVTFPVQETVEEKNIRLLGSVDLGEGGAHIPPKVITKSFKDGLTFKRVCH